MDALARRLNELCDALPFQTSWYLRDLTTGRHAEDVPVALPDGTPGFAAANQLIGRMARLAYDTLGR
jgi:hypothetical protein